MTKLLRFAKKHAVLCIAALAALVTCFFVPPDKEYVGYFDFRTLACLFLTLAVIAALRNIKFFTILSRRLVVLAGSLRTLFLLLLAITFIGSMIIANDMALITFLPLGYFALSVSKKEKYAAFLFILQNITANLGGMLTPFGNPQNLYLYSFFHIETGEFLSIMAWPFFFSICLIVLFCFFVKNEKLVLCDDYSEKLNVKKALLYLALFALSLLIVFRVIDYRLGIVLIVPILFFADHEAILMVDYPLLFTFFFFFIFAGNLSRIPAVHALFSSLLGVDTFLFSTLSCQAISNVPSAILLSRFTDNYRALLLGVNVGGVGTLISSLASLITFSEFCILYPTEKRRYLTLFAVLNAVFLLALILFVKLLGLA
ncbi:MAG: citrate transporter [Clostridia bacterium]|nr:citrate transporter [Clostridia bacterium]